MITHSHIANTVLHHSRTVEDNLAVALPCPLTLLSVFPVCVVLTDRTLPRQ